MKKKVYYGWWIVVTCTAIMALVYGSCITFPGIFTVPVTAEFGWSRTAFTTHLSIATFAGMLSLLISGNFMKKFGMKKVMFTAGAIITLCFFGYSFANQVWHFYLISAIVGLSSMCICSVPTATLINSWFGPKKKGLAMGIVMTGSSIASIVFNPLLSSINAALGWRMGYRILGICMLVLVLPLVFFTVVETPEQKGLQQLGRIEDSGEGKKEKKIYGPTVGQAMKSAMFWMLIVTCFLLCVSMTIFSSSGVSYFQDCGLDATRAGTMMSIVALVLIFGKIAEGKVSDVIGTKWGTTVFCIIRIVGLVLLAAVVNAPGLAVAAAIVLGAGNAVGTVSYPLIAADMFGTRSYATLFGYVQISCNLGSTIGPVIASAVCDATGSYSGAYYIAIAIMVIMMVALWLLYPLRDKTYKKLNETAI